MPNPPGWDAYLVTIRAWLAKRHRTRKMTLAEVREYLWRRTQQPPKGPVSPESNPLPYPSDLAALEIWTAWAAALPLGPGGYPMRPPPPTEADPEAWKAWHEALPIGPGGHPLHLAPHTLTESELAAWLAWAEENFSPENEGATSTVGHSVSDYDVAIDGPRPTPFGFTGSQ